MVVYALDHENRFPAEDVLIQTLWELGLIEKELLVSPLEDGDGISYIFTGEQDFTFSNTQILAYEDPDHYESAVLVLFGDISLRWIPNAEFEQLLAAQESQAKPPAAVQP